MKNKKNEPPEIAIKWNNGATCLATCTRHPGKKAFYNYFTGWVGDEEVIGAIKERPKFQQNVESVAYSKIFS